MLEFKLDEDFEGFLEDFGMPEQQESCSSITLEKFKNKLPERLLEYWQEYGFCSFKQGLFRIVNPSDYEDLLGEWLEPTDIPDNDVYHVFARNAFGDLFLWGEETGYKYKVMVARGWVIEKKGKVKKDHNTAIEYFFGFLDTASHDFKDEAGNVLFESCIKKFGALAPNEMFGFEPSLIVGGEANFDNINKVNIFVHLSILAQFGQIEVLDHDALIRKAFS
ncbi:DUF1851 domain-containing protein [Pseudoalteromonas sp. N1230-9]|uniref:GAD-like domain-containing protein n=1 Tax=Pseudoalteromonas sp. N1230-9 TaxID=2907156 RepID=UPI002B30A911|nr:DUF1851 domain-containing protein [Pseudoalteromonas sp. N1230-9]